MKRWGGLNSRETILNPLGFDYAVYLVGQGELGWGTLHLFGNVKRWGWLNSRETILDPIGFDYAVYLVGQGGLGGTM